MQIAPEQETENRELSLFGLWSFLALTALLLATTRMVHYLLFHTLAEVFAITVGFSIFTLTWASRRHLTNGYLIVLGAAYATIGLVDVFHTLTFKGMNLLPGVTSNHPTQFWLTARFIEALALSIAPLFARHRPNFDRMTFGFAVLGTLGVMAVLSGILPPTFEDGVGLTHFKIVTEYVIVLILLLGLWLLGRIRQQFTPLVFRLLNGSVLLAIATEICFIHYVGFYDLVNELGHYFRFLSVVMAYLALVVTGVRRPAELLYRQLAESEARYRTLYETTPAMLHSIDASGCLVSVSQHWLESLGYTRAEVIGRKSTDFMSEESRQRATTEVLPTFYRLGQVSNVPYEMLTKDGRSIDVLLSGTGERDAAGNIVRSLAVMQNVTEQKLAERNVAELLTFNQKIIEQSSTGIAVFTAEGQCVMANEVLANSLGVALADVLAQNFFASDFWRQSDLFDAARAALDQQRIVRRNVDLQTAAGHEVALACSFTTARLGGKVHLVVLANDISHFRRSEKVLQEARLAAESANLAKGVFLANMSHEIRTPMNAIIGLTEVVLEGSLEEKQRGYLQQAQKSSRALLGILNDILDYSKIESGHLEPDSVEFHLEDSLRSASDLFGAQIDEKGLEWSMDIDPALPAIVLGDPMYLEQVLNNLLSNAVKFTPAGKIRLHAEFLEQKDEQVYVRISVQDTGIGLTEQQAARLFQPFVQADASITRKFGGTGLGLAISRRLVRLMGGEISVASTLGHGSCFTFTACFGAGTASLRPQSRVRQKQIPTAPSRTTESGSRKVSTILVPEDNALADTDLAALVRSIEPLLRELERQLETKSFSARQVAVEIEHRLDNLRLNAEFRPVGCAVKDLNYEAARAHLNQFLHRFLR